MKEENNNAAQPEGVKSLKALLPYLFRHKVLLIFGTVAVLFTILVSFAMGLGISYVIDSFPSGAVEVEAFLTKVVTIALVIIIFSNIMQFVANYNLEKVSMRVTEEIRCNVFKNIVRKDLSYIENQASGDLQTRIVSDTSAVGGFLAQQVPTIVASLLSLLAGIIGALYISAKLTLVVLVCVPMIFLPFIILSKKLRGMGEMVRTAIAEIGRFAGETFRNVKVVRAYGKEKDENDRFVIKAGDNVRAQLRASKLQIGLTRVVETLAFVGFSILLWSASMDIVKGSMTVGELVAFAYFAFLIVRSAGQFFTVVSAVNVAVGTAKKVLEYLHLENLEWPTVVTQTQGDGSIEMSNVGFSYPNRPDVPVLTGIDLNIRQGETVAFVGSSGAGKSTILELLLGFYDAEHGTIKVGGNDIRELDKGQLRAMIGYVPQKDGLISGTVMDNIRYGKADADEQSVVMAAKMAHAAEFIEQLPQGYETDLGEVGDKLSGGQRQRIALARAFVRNPRILLLDEASSGLDTTSERIVGKAIEQWSKLQNATVVVITHTLSTVEHADKIVVLDHGVVVGQGSHEELLSTCEVYQRLKLDVGRESNAETVNLEELTTA